MRRLLPAVGLITLLLAPAAARASDPVSVGEIHRALRNTAVYADPSASPTLSATDAKRLSAEIRKRDRDRIFVAVVSAAQVKRAGGLDNLTHALRGRLRAPGALVTVSGEDAFVLVSYSDGRAAVNALGNAVAKPGSFYGKLRQAVIYLDIIDPGHPGDIGQSSTIKVPLLAVVLLIFGIPAVVVFMVARRLAARHRREDAEREPAEVAELHAALGTFGSEVDALAIALAAQAPGAEPAAREAVEQAAARRHRADWLLDQEPDGLRLLGVRTALQEGEELLDAARAALAKPPAKAERQAEEKAAEKPAEPKAKQPEEKPKPKAKAKPKPKPKEKPEPEPEPLTPAAQAKAKAKAKRAEKARRRSQAATAKANGGKPERVKAKAKASGNGAEPESANGDGAEPEAAKSSGAGPNGKPAEPATEKTPG